MPLKLCAHISSFISEQVWIHTRDRIDCGTFWWRFGGNPITEKHCFKYMIWENGCGTKSAEFQDLGGLQWKPWSPRCVGPRHFAQSLVDLIVMLGTLLCFTERHWLSIRTTKSLQHQISFISYVQVFLVVSGNLWNVHSASVQLLLEVAVVISVTSWPLS